MSKEPFTIGYEYDDSGRLVRYFKSTEDTQAFTYDGKGRLTGCWTVNEGLHRLELDAKNRVIRESYELPGIGRISVRYEYDREGTSPLVYGNGNISFGESRSYFSYPGKPEVKLAETTFGGPDGAVNLIQTYHADGTKADSYLFIYECDDEQSFEELKAAGLVTAAPKTETVETAREAAIDRHRGRVGEQRRKVDNFRTTIFELANNCENVKKQTVGIIADGLQVSLDEAQGYWGMWAADHDTSGLPEVPTMIVNFKKQQVEAWGLILRTHLDDPSIPKPCQDALRQAALDAGNACIGDGSPRKTRWIRTAGSEACGLDPHTPSTSYCGSDRALPSAETLPNWMSWGCRSEGQAGYKWSECVGREVYSGEKGTGCPGKSRCCPPL